MCGIFGSITPNKIEISNNILPHRGPDDWGVDSFLVNSKHFTLFQSRLSIIGIGNQGHQPFSKYKEYKLVFNGEIYNFQSIKKKLIQERSINFITETDTEVLYEAIINYGIENTLKLLNGIFAFAFTDLITQSLVLVRDHLGIKPLYYYQKESQFLFSSEIKSFFILNLVSPQLNREKVGEYLANGWVYEPDTLFQDIFKLESGHYLKYNLSDGNSSITRYWSLNQKESNSSKLETLICEQTISDVPIGNYLSGGIDSSIISIILKDFDVLNLNMDLGDEETKRIKVLKELYDLNLRTFQPNGFPLSIYTELIYNLDEPIADPAIIPAFLLAKASRDCNRTVMLSGIGGDEIDGGYARQYIIKYLDLLGIIKVIPLWISFFLNKKQRRDFNRLKNFYKNPSPVNYFALTSFLGKNEIDDLIPYKWYEEYQIKIERFTKDYSGAKKFYMLDFKGFLSSHNLIYMDKASMAASVEVRVPLLEKGLVNNFFMDYGKNIGKKRLKGVLKDLLGKKYVNNKKNGFRYPIRDWLLNEINWIEIFDFFDKTKLLNTDKIKNYLTELRNGNDTEMKLWIIYTLYLWLITFKVSV